MAEGMNPESPLPDDAARSETCAICGKSIEKGADVIVTALQNAVHAQCAARMAA